MGDLKDPRPVRGLQLWVIPTLNPDGEALGRRQNAAGVDLSTNVGADRAAESGRCNSGPAAWGEPESRAVRDFRTRVRPGELVSLRSPSSTATLPATTTTPAPPATAL
ncbi:M14 family zinc carboxypeptidase [Tessaracoccus antarcticus]|nr:M14 family zinc carboxypeptidase [Tessaracoccus antarcticus]